MRRAWRAALQTLVSGALLCTGLLAQPLGVCAQSGPPPEMEPQPYPDPSQQQAFHILAPGDNLEVRLYSAAGRESYSPVVDARGEVTLPEVGHVKVAGLRVDEAAALLEQRFGEYFRNAFVDISLASFGRIRIAITGPYVGSQIRDLENRETLYDLLKDTMASTLRYRRIAVIRGYGSLFATLAAQPQAGSAAAAGLGGATEAAAQAVVAHTPGGTIDSLTSALNHNRWVEDALSDPAARVEWFDSRDMLRGGDLGALNFRLEEGDIIFMPAPEVLVEVDGVSLSGLYGLLPGESLADLMQLCGYVNNPEADLRNLVVQRYDDSGCFEQAVVNAAPVAGDLERLSGFIMRNRDVVRIVDSLKQVFVLGEVGRPGVVDYNPTMQLMDYLAVGGGISEDAHLPFIAIVRHARDLGRPCLATDIVPVDLRVLYRGECPEDWRILPGDVIYVPPKGASITLSTVTSAVNTLFLGLNFFDNLNDGNSSSSSANKTTSR